MHSDNGYCSVLHWLTILILQGVHNQLNDWKCWKDASLNCLPNRHVWQVKNLSKPKPPATINNNLLTGYEKFKISRSIFNIWFSSKLAASVFQLPNSVFLPNNEYPIRNFQYRSYQQPGTSFQHQGPSCQYPATRNKYTETLIPLFLRGLADF